jgi:hypothetical protein
MRRVSVISVVAASALLATNAAAFEVGLIKDKVRSFVVGAQTCAMQMAAIGFYFDEIRTEIDLTPKIEMYFRDGGSSVGGVPDTVTGPCRNMARILLKTREVQYAGYRLKGVKLTLPNLKAELIHMVAP